MNEQQRQYFKAYLQSTGADDSAAQAHVSVDCFCADEDSANACAVLVMQGHKTASTSMKYWYEHAGERMPRVDDLQIVVDWNGTPACIIQTTDVSECAFIDVSAEFAALEGEGDGSLAYWRRTHWDFFMVECQAEGFEPSEDMMLVLEKFRVVYS